MTAASQITAQALAALNAFGQTITYTPGGAGTYDPSASTNSTAPVTPKTFKAVVEDVLNIGRGVQLSAVGDKKFSFAATSLGQLPALTDMVQSDGIGYAVTDVNTYYVGDTAVMYVVQARRS